MWRKPRRSRIPCDIADPKRGWLANQQAENPAPVRELADGGALVLIQPARDEVGKVDTVCREHAEGAVLRVGQVDCEVDDALQERRERELCCQREARFKQTFGAAATQYHPPR